MTKVTAPTVRKVMEAMIVWAVCPNRICSQLLDIRKTPFSCSVTITVTSRPTRMFSCRTGFAIQTCRDRSETTWKTFWAQRRRLVDPISRLSTTCSRTSTARRQACLPHSRTTPQRSVFWRTRLLVRTLAPLFGIRCATSQLLAGSMSDRVTLLKVLKRRPTVRKSATVARRVRQTSTRTVILPLRRTRSGSSVTERPPTSTSKVSRGQIRRVQAPPLT